MTSDPPPVAPAQPDSFAVAAVQQAQQQDTQAAQSDLSQQDLGLRSTFGLGSGVSIGARGASMAGAVNGLSSVALMPLGAH